MDNARTTDSIVKLATLTSPTGDPVTRGLLALPGAQYHPTGGGCGVILVSTERYVFGIGGDDIAMLPTQRDTHLQISVYPRFGRSDPLEIFDHTQYEVPTFSQPAKISATRLMEHLQAYEMSPDDRLRAIRACGEHQAAIHRETGQYPPGVVCFSHDGIAIYDPFTDEGGMRTVVPDTYYGDAFRTSPFFR